MLEKEFKFYLDNQSALLETYGGSFIVIKGNEVLGSYNSEIEALTESRKSNEVGTFLIQKCSPGDEDYTETYHSRVVIND
ncbi:hypothetical protein [Maribacter sp. Hel_I_7]|uniref:hypothetical protein n=1 Tax=Maribacter sp. Hel_I_7 TaxID=1249997 RepID=UPI00047C2622|nr:hypothetical protein [Maribacter sp. Hel_I_7]